MTVNKLIIHPCFCTALNSECWTKTYNVRGFVGRPVKVKDVKECVAACDKYDGCVAIDWVEYNIERPCWIQRSTKTAMTAETGDVVHYERVPDCIDDESGN